MDPLAILSLISELYANLAKSAERIKELEKALAEAQGVVPRDA